MYNFSIVLRFHHSIDIAVSFTHCSSVIQNEARGGGKAINPTVSGVLIILILFQSKKKYLDI